MNAKDRYNAMIERIEERAFSKDCHRAGRILEEVCRMAGLGVREINAVFSFLTGMPLLEYIKERKLMASYSFLIKGEEFDVNTPLEIAGYDNQSSYGKRFKERFDMTPTEAYARKTASLFTKPLRWENISVDDEAAAAMIDQVRSVPETLFGIDVEQMELIQQANDLRVVFGLNNVQSNTAYQLALTENVDMLRAFEFVDEFTQKYCLNTDRQFTMTQKQFQKAVDEHLDLFHLCIKLDYPVKRAAYMLDTMRHYGYQPEDIPPKILSCFHWGDVSFTEFMELYRSYEHFGGVTPFDEYMTLVLEEGYSEDHAALGDDLYFGDIDLYIEDPREELRRDEEYMGIEEWAQKETDYANADYFGYEPDMDNLGYDD